MVGVVEDVKRDGGMRNRLGNGRPTSLMWDLLFHSMTLDESVAFLLIPKNSHHFTEQHNIRVLHT